MKSATRGQILHINSMFLNGGLSRGRFEEVNRMAVERTLTFQTAKAITEGTFVFACTPSDAHLAKVRRVWEVYGKPVFGVSFEKYLNGTDKLEAIPMLPAWPDPWQTNFDRDVLVDGRVVERIGLKEACKLGGLAYNGENDTLIAHDPAVAMSGLRWMRGQDGHKNRNRRPSDCRTSFADFEVGMDYVEGVFTYVDDPGVIKGHYMDLPGSVPRDNRGDVACLGHWYGGPRLLWHWYDNPPLGYGSASRGSLGTR